MPSVVFRFKALLYLGYFAYSKGEKGLDQWWEMSFYYGKTRWVALIRELTEAFVLPKWWILRCR